MARALLSGDLFRCRSAALALTSGVRRAIAAALYSGVWWYARSAAFASGVWLYARATALAFGVCQYARRAALRSGVWFRLC